MSTNCSKNISGNRQKKDSFKPQPGEIWEVERGVYYFLNSSPSGYLPVGRRCANASLLMPGNPFGSRSWGRPPRPRCLTTATGSQYQQNKLYSDVAAKFLVGDSTRRFVMIVTVSEPQTRQEINDQLVSVMMLSSQTNLLSDVDLLIPKDISGLEQDVLAETWLVSSMLCCNLLQPVGKRLSRQVYDLLLDVGDYYHGLINKPPIISEINATGLQIGSRKASDSKEIQAFHQDEVAWSDVLRVPVAAYNTYEQAMKFTEAVFNEALEVERDFLEVNNSDQVNLQQASKILVSRIILSRWLQNIFDADWQEFLQPTSFAIATRSASENNPEPNHSEIAALIQQLSLPNEHQQRKAAKRLGEIGVGSALVTQALVNLLRTTQNDETLWTTVESLRHIDPENPAVGIRRVKQIDLGMQVKGVAVALAVSLVEKENQRVSVLLQVYPTANNTYLPANLKLMLLDERGNLLREVTSRDADIYIQLKLNGTRGEEFSVRVALGEIGITEDFTI
ncbi:MAG: DUF1822 family protein [Cyanobacteria bacterium P01_H01_bin.150]